MIRCWRPLSALLLTLPLSIGCASSGSWYDPCYDACVQYAEPCSNSGGDCLVRNPFKSRSRSACSACDPCSGGYVNGCAVGGTSFGDPGFGSTGCSSCQAGAMAAPQYAPGVQPTFQQPSYPQPGYPQPAPAPMGMPPGGIPGMNPGAGGPDSVVPPANAPGTVVPGGAASMVPGTTYIVSGGELPPGATWGEMPVMTAPTLPVARQNGPAAGIIYQPQQPVQHQAAAPAPNAAFGTNPNYARSPMYSSAPQSSAPYGSNATPAPAFVASPHPGAIR